jgi:DNA-binding transcriptional ArsR family regulator
MLNCFSLFLQYGYYTRKRAIIVALKEQMSITVCDVAHSVGVSRSNVSRLLKTRSETRCHQNGKENVDGNIKQHPELTNC